MSNQQTNQSVSDVVNRVRSQKAPFGDPTKLLVHRVRNEATEKEMADVPWCGSEQEAIKSHVTILDCDVTCPLCLAVIDKRKASREAVRPPVNPKITTHFPAWDGKTLCGVEFGEYRHRADTLRETGCAECQTVAEEIIIDYMPTPRQPNQDKMEEAFNFIEKVARNVQEERQYRTAILEVWGENNAALRDIAETLSAINMRLEIQWTEKK